MAPILWFIWCSRIQELSQGTEGLEVQTSTVVIQLHPISRTSLGKHQKPTSPEILVATLSEAHVTEEADERDSKGEKTKVSSARLHRNIIHISLNNCQRRVEVYLRYMIV